MYSRMYKKKARMGKFYIRTLFGLQKQKIQVDIEIIVQ